MKKGGIQKVSTQKVEIAPYFGGQRSADERVKAQKKWGL
jgi:hypothetical protein